MTDHLPECPMALPKVSPMDFHLDFPQDCICDRLRACEQRVTADHGERLRIVYQTGIAGGRMEALQAARHAVAARLTRMGYDTEDTNPYLAAIDALKGEQT